MNWIEELDEILASVEDTVKGYEGDLITKARGIIQKNIISNSEAIDEQNKKGD